MSQWLGAIWLVVGFAVLIQLLGLTKQSGDVVRISLDSLQVIGANELSDEQKESQLQKNSQKLFGLFFILLTKGAIALLLPLASLWLTDLLGWLSVDRVLTITVSPVFLVIGSILAIAILWFKPKSKGDCDLSPASSYSQLDRTLHQLAFNTYSLQKSLARLEDRILSRQLAKCSNERPVFITALPRAGTTLLLECLAQSPEFAAHCYRDMPFVMIPYLWNRFSSPFQQQVESTERAHGDGMQINPDSHEALEEVVWQTFWQRHYHRDRLIPWDYEENQEFQDFMATHMQKIIYLRRPRLTQSARYVSKNNANIARIKTINKLLPDAAIVVPFRDPLQHANSLLQQHLNFLQIHQEDPFAAKYMAAIGHYDFGKNLRPIDFDNWLDRRQISNATDLAFWLEYWTASYQHLLQENSELVHFFDYDELCHQSDRGLKRLAAIVQSQNPQALLAFAPRIRNPKLKAIDTSNVLASIVAEANKVYDHLRSRCH
ncbi:MAG: sulfotransferase [Cyanobacteria bacterium P01_G01_bin.19]